MGSSSLLIEYPKGAIDQLVTLIGQAGKRPLLVGIDGPGGAGKSTLARYLVGRLNCPAVVVQGDHFYRDMPEDERLSLDAREGMMQYFDWQRLRHQVLEPVATGERVMRYQRYDWDAAGMGGWVEVPMPDVVVVEGVYMLRPELRDLVDVKAFVDANEEVRLQRQAGRGENTDDWIKRWAAAEDLYLSEVAPRSLADILIGGA